MEFMLHTYHTTTYLPTDRSTARYPIRLKGRIPWFQVCRCVAPRWQREENCPLFISFFVVEWQSSWYLNNEVSRFLPHHNKKQDLTGESPPLLPTFSNLNVPTWGPHTCPTLETPPGIGDIYIYRMMPMMMVMMVIMTVTLQPHPSPWLSSAARI
jgi:hypothetical protein